MWYLNTLRSLTIKGVLDNAVQLFPVCKAGLETKFLVQNTSIMQKNPFNSIIRKEAAAFDLSLIFSCSFNSSSLGGACVPLTCVSYCVVLQITGFLPVLLVHGEVRSLCPVVFSSFFLPTLQRQRELFATCGRDSYA